MNEADAFVSSPCGLAVLAPDGTFLRVNERFCAWTGFDGPELVGAPFARLLDDDGKKAAADLIGDAGGGDEIFLRLRRKSGGSLPVWLNFSRVKDASGAARVNVALFRAERQLRQQAELRRGKLAAEQLAAIVSTSIDAIVSFDPNGVILTANQAFSDLFQYPPAEVVGARLADLIVPTESHEELNAKLRDAARAPMTPRIVRRRRRDGALLDLSLSTAPIRDDEGEVFAISAIYRDVAPLMRASEHIEFLLREVNHRSKNMLAVVQAVARQTARRAATADEFIDAFMGRLVAISSSHDLLVSRDWRGVQIADLTKSQFSHLDPEQAARIGIAGDYLEINPRAAEAYGLALHELATNAARHGALSNADGRVALRFAFERREKSYVLTWTETGGPAVVEPPAAGFGALVLTRMSPMAITGEGALDYRPEGLFYRLSAPVASVAMRAD